MIKNFKDNWKWILLAIFLGAVVGSFSCSWEVGVLMFTAVLLIWYSLETRGLRIQAMEANRISVYPGLNLQYKRKEGGGDWNFILRNFGNGVALNPKIETDFSDMSFDLNGLSAIYPNEEVYISWEYKGKKYDKSVLSQFFEAPMKVRILCSLVMDPMGEFVTDVEIKNPPYSKITKLSWL